MNDSTHLDLEQVCSQFAAWRATKKNHAHIPEPLWEAALALLDRYPLDLLCRRLALKPAFVRKRLERLAPPLPSDSAFLEVVLPGPNAVALASAPEPPPAGPSPLPLLRLQIERADGARLSLQFPTSDPDRLHALLLAFAHGGVQ